jgi:hypothetical protein
MAPRKPASPEADEQARKERARQLREQIRGLSEGKPRPKSPRELTDEAAMEEALKEEGPACDRDGDDERK